MKILFFTMLVIILFPLVSAADFEATLVPIVDHINENQVASFRLTIDNSGKSSNFEIFSLNSDFFFASEGLTIGSGGVESKVIRLHPQTDKSALYGVTLFIKNQLTDEVIEKRAKVKFTSVDDSISIRTSPRTLDVTSDTFFIEIKNRADIDLGNIIVEAKSNIFEENFQLNLDSKAEKVFEVVVDLEKAEGGEHPIFIKIYNENELVSERELSYYLEEIHDLKESRSISGFLIKEKTVTFVNEGNVVENVKISETSTIFDKIFGFSSIKPSFENENGVLKANWNINIEAYSTKVITSKTNFLIPLILLIILLVGFTFTINYQSKGLIVTKSVTKAKSTRGSAFKVTVKVKNRKEAVRELKVRDFLPKGLKVHQRFDFKKPDKIEGNHIEWYVDLLHGGSEQVFTYYLYTEEEVVESLVLPVAAVKYLTLHRDKGIEYSGSVRLETKKEASVKK